MKALAMMEWKQSLFNKDVKHLDDDTLIPEIPKDEPPLLQFWSKSVERSLLTNHPEQLDRLFLPGTTVLASYPRSGNTLVRSLLESTTGFATSSDTRADRSLSIALADKHDLVGEGRVTDPICKTHWPERVGCTPYTAARIILLVRNPWDAIDSYWHLNLTNTHTEKATEQAYKDHQEFFQKLVRNELAVWLMFLEYYWKLIGVPVLLVRYEDLILDRKKEVERMLNFCTPNDWWRPRLDASLGGGAAAKQSIKNGGLQHGYQSSTSSLSSSSSPTSSIGRSVLKRLYTPKLLQEMHDMSDFLDENGWLERLGYHISRQGFPKNVHCLPELPVKEDTNGENFETIASFPINEPFSHELRPRSSPYGRNMRQWRRQFTDDDRTPFPTV
ncbi:MAG: hypothetical protein SGILL_000711 [Bacillariaceae sp.]